MTRSRLSEEQINGILREQEARAVTADVCQRHRILSATFNKWKARYGRMHVSEAKRLRTLENENARLKKLLAESMRWTPFVRQVCGGKQLVSAGIGYWLSCRQSGWRFSLIRR